MYRTVIQVVTERSAAIFKSIKRTDDDGLLASISPKHFNNLGPYLFGHWRGNIRISNVTGIHFKSIQRSQCQCDLDCFTSNNAGIRDSGWSICHIPLLHISPCGGSLPSSCQKSYGNGKIDNCEGYGDHRGRRRTPPKHSSLLWQ